MLDRESAREQFQAVIFSMRNKGHSGHISSNSESIQCFVLSCANIANESKDAFSYQLCVGQLTMAHKQSKRHDFRISRPLKPCSFDRRPTYCVKTMFFDQPTFNEQIIFPLFSQNLTNR